MEINIARVPPFNGKGYVMNAFKTMYFRWRRNQNLKVLRHAKRLLRVDPYDSHLTEFICVSIRKSARRHPFQFLSYGPDLWSSVIEHDLMGIPGRSIAAVFHKIGKMAEEEFNVKRTNIWMFSGQYEAYEDTHRHEQFLIQHLRHQFLDQIIEDVEVGKYDDIRDLIVGVKPFDFSIFLKPEFRKISYRQ